MLLIILSIIFAHTFPSLVAFLVCYATKMGLYPPLLGVWQSHYVPARLIEQKYSDWGQILSEPGIFVFWKSSDGKVYEVAIHRSWWPWIWSHGLEFHVLCKADFAKPSVSDEEAYGIASARERIKVRNLESAIIAIRSRPGIESWLRHSVSVDQPSLERAILDRDIDVRQALMLLSIELTLHRNPPLRSAID